MFVFCQASHAKNENVKYFSVSSFFNQILITVDYVEIATVELLLECMFLSYLMLLAASNEVLPGVTMLFNELNDKTQFHHQRYLPNMLSEQAKVEGTLHGLQEDSENQVRNSNCWNPWVMRELANYAVLKNDPDLLEKILGYYRGYCNVFTDRKDWTAEDWNTKEADIKKMQDKIQTM